MQIALPANQRKAAESQTIVIELTVNYTGRTSLITRTVNEDKQASKTQVGEARIGTFNMKYM